MAQRTRPWRLLSFRLSFTVLIVSLMILLTNIILYRSIDEAVEAVELVYQSNRNLNDLDTDLEGTREALYSYLTSRSSDDLEAYFGQADRFAAGLAILEPEVRHDAILLQEKNLRAMGTGYLALCEEAIQAKRGRNIELYLEKYAELSTVASYISSEIVSLNNSHLQLNAARHLEMMDALQDMQRSIFLILGLVTAAALLMAFAITRSITSPLSHLARASQAVTAGNFDLQLPEAKGHDEITQVTRSFNHMLVSIHAYVQQIRENATEESRLREREILMSERLKDAQLKYLQAQINPHFLFNSLNAAMQLTMMEDAPRSSLYIEHLSEFFRYNVRTMQEDTDLAGELAVTRNYIHIMNVRYEGDILYREHVDQRLLKLRLPSLVIQPLVENAVNYGVRGKAGGGRIDLVVRRHGADLLIEVRDDGHGIAAQELERIRSGRPRTKAEEKGLGESSGIGLQNVRSRLRLYFNRDDVLDIDSPGAGQGTVVRLLLPLSVNPQEVTTTESTQESIQPENTPEAADATEGRRLYV